MQQLFPTSYNQPFAGMNMNPVGPHEPVLTTSQGQHQPFSEHSRLDQNMAARNNSGIPPTEEYYRLTGDYDGIHRPSSSSWYFISYVRAVRGPSSSVALSIIVTTSTI